MPQLQNVNLTTVSTKNEPFKEGTYIFIIKESEIKDNKTLIIKHKCIGGDDPAAIDREWWNWINLVQNDGKPNRVGAIQVKRYMEAVFGEGSVEAESTSPDTDALNGAQVKIFLSVESYTPTGKTEERFKNEAKLIQAA